MPTFTITKAEAIKRAKLWLLDNYPPGSVIKTGDTWLHVRYEVGIEVTLGELYTAVQHAGMYCNTR